MLVGGGYGVSLARGGRGYAVPAPGGGPGGGIVGGGYAP